MNTLLEVMLGIACAGLLLGALVMVCALLAAIPLAIVSLFV